jgi:hypothetical protein
MSVSVLANPRFYWGLFQELSWALANIMPFDLFYSAQRKNTHTPPYTKTTQKQAPPRLAPQGRGGGGALETQDTYKNS